MQSNSGKSGLVQVPSMEVGMRPFPRFSLFYLIFILFNYTYSTTFLIEKHTVHHAKSTVFLPKCSLAPLNFNLYLEDDM